MIEGMAVNSIGPWDDYDQVDNISYAGRIKADLTDLFIGTVQPVDTAQFPYWLHTRSNLPLFTAHPANPAAGFILYQYNDGVTVGVYILYSSGAPIPVTETIL